MGKHTEDGRRPTVTRTRSGPSAQLTQRERRKRKSRSAQVEGTGRAVLEAAREVFEERGFVKARVADIAEAADVSHGSFYSYFSSKKDVFQALVEIVDAELNEATHRHGSDDLDPVQAVLNANRRMYDVYARNRRFITVIEQAGAIHPEFNQTIIRHRSEFVRRYSAVLRQLQEDGQVDPQIDAYHAAGALGSMVWDALRWWLQVREDHDPDVAIDTLNTLWLRSIGLAAGPSPHDDVS